MGTRDSSNDAVRPGSGWGWLYALFFLSGISGLLYEVVWLRLLGRVLGNTAYATATVLAAFMGGLALGSWAAGKASDSWRRPLVRYAALELGVALAALGTLVLPDALAPVYRVLHALAGGSRAWLTAGQVVIALAMLLLPTALMGATLPTLGAWAARRHLCFTRCIGTLYAWNTLGAVVGSLAAGFVLLGTVGETRTVLIGVGLNVAVAAMALVRGRGEAPRIGALHARDILPEAPAAPLYSAGVRKVVLGCAAAGGFVLMASEVVWGRLLLLYQGTSVYAFSALLAVLLSGMGLGSLLAARWAARGPNPLRLLACTELALGVAGLAALLLYGRAGLDRPDLATGRNLGALVLVPLVLVGPLGLLAGIAFPLAVRCCMPGPEAAGRSLGALYAGNTLGCIAGAVGGGFLLVPWLGAGRAGLALAVLSLLLGVVLYRLLPDRRPWEMPLATLLLALGGGLLALAEDPHTRLLRRHLEQVYPGRVSLFRHVEGPACTLTAFGATDADPRDKHLWLDGHGMTALLTATKLMAHLPLWLADDPHDALVVCFGMGTTVRSACRHDGLAVTTVELVPAVLDCFGYYHADGPALLRRPNVRAVVDDGRNVLLMEPRRYDVLTIDPAPPLYGAGAVHLYTREFFQLCRARIRPGGVVCLWVPPANGSEVKAILRTFLSVFPHVSLWEGPGSNIENKGFYLLGTMRRLHDVPERIRAGYQEASVVADLVEWGPECDRPEKVLALWLADEETLHPFVVDAPIITDDRPYTEFPLWRCLLAEEDYREILNGPALRRHLKDRLPAGARGL